MYQARPYFFFSSAARKMLSIDPKEEPPLALFANCFQLPEDF
jgi:hypothetical protein